jgi:hypothetical protein
VREQVRRGRNAAANTVHGLALAGVDSRFDGPTGTLVVTIHEGVIGRIDVAGNSVPGPAFRA